MLEKWLPNACWLAFLLDFVLYSSVSLIALGVLKHYHVHSHALNYLQEWRSRLYSVLSDEHFLLIDLGVSCAFYDRRCIE